MTDDERAEMAMVDAANRDMVAEWLYLERTRYADVKYEPGGDNYIARLEDIRVNGLDVNSTEMVFLLNYLKRAEMFGVDTLQGKQAFGKFVVTATAIFERIVLAHGRPPQPGVASGEITEWGA